MTWTKEDLQEFARKNLSVYKLIVVSNREPYVHTRQGGRIECIQPAGGMTAALDPVMRVCGGSWIAHGSGDADREVVDLKGRIAVPPKESLYTLRRVWLTEEQQNGYYYGLANQGLWPLCHIVFQRPIFNDRDWEIYRQVNELFAEAVLDEARSDRAFVFIQDYHFGLLPRLLKDRNPNLIVAQFWHIPWPNRETFRAFPWGEELLDGLLGNDLLGFHLRYYCQNFLSTIDRGIEAKVDQERFNISRNGQITAVRPFPISIDFKQHASEARSPAVNRTMEQWRKKLGLRGEFLGLGIDRIDYTKGIPERLRVLDLLLQHYPNFRGKIVFVQIGVPSRPQISGYRRLDAEIEALIREINSKWGTASWRPVIFIKRHLEPVQMMGLHRLATFCMVNSLHDGMNLVAKEFVSSRHDDDGVLILSRFTGAARELPEALLVNPYDPGECVRAVLRALEMPAHERKQRMEKMRASVAKKNIYRWAARIIETVTEISASKSAYPPCDEKQSFNDAGPLSSASA